jgi:hypothetical protein
MTIPPWLVPWPARLWPPPRDGQLEVAFPRKGDNSRHVLCVGYPRDHERVAINALEENRARVVLSGIVERD